MCKLKPFILSLIFISFSATAKDPTEELWQKGVELISLGKNHEAEAVFLKMLSLSLDFFPKMDSSPKIIKSFQSARKRFLKQNHAHTQALREKLEAHLGQRELQLTIKIPESFNPFLTKIKVFFRTEEHLVFRSMTFFPPFSFEKQRLDCPIINNVDSVYYYIEYIGRYDEAFAQIGSPSAPLLARAKRVPLTFTENAKPLDAFTKLKEGWPLLAYAGLILVGGFTYSLISLGF